jgi:anthraniloyl-CoA monooxygenase
MMRGMRITVVGGGPAGLYFALLMQQADSAHRITVHERNRADDTFGFGVVFSDETLNAYRQYDITSFQAITDAFAYWDAIDVHYRGEVVRSTGHGFAGLARVRLLQILQQRCVELGVELRFQSELTPDTADDADLVVIADGANSTWREHFRDAFAPRIDLRPNRFTWMGSTTPLPAFTFIVRDTAHGIWNVHAYQYAPDRATWIFETTDETWRAAGLDGADEAASVAYLERVFAAELNGHRLITNRSLWRQFPIVRCARWHHRNMVLLGDAAHTAHFSIGSGTKLAMEDAIALFEAFRAKPQVADALPHYEATRRDEVERTQHAAYTSLVWFETVKRYWSMPPLQLAYSLLSRSKQITHENLRLRDPVFVGRVEQWFAGSNRPAAPMFKPFQLRGLELANRVVVSPMAQYSARDGTPDDWHLVHLGSRAVGGAGLVYTEMTCVAPDARITPGCTGMYTRKHVAAWKRIVDFVHARSGAKLCLQLGHAGRKGSTKLGWEGMDEPLDSGNWPLISASAIAYQPGNQVPRAMTARDMRRVTTQFVRATAMAVEAGFDMLELHMAHGYLLASFLSPLTNTRRDDYGGTLENRLRFPLAVFDAVRAVWPQDRPLAVRISAVDWMPDGNTTEDAVAIARALQQHGCDLIDVSAGQTVPEQQPVYGRMFQTPFADAIRNDVGIATMAVGNITSADQVNTTLAAGRADLVALARPHLADPYFTLNAAAEHGNHAAVWPEPYLPGRDQASTLRARARDELAALRRAARPPSPNRRTPDRNGA